MALCRHDIDTAVSTCIDCLPVGRMVRHELEPSMFGPWCEARFDGHCAGCDEEIAAGDDIRSDGQRGWLGRCCGEDYVPARLLPQFPDPKDVLRGQLAAGSVDRGQGTGPR